MTSDKKTRRRYSELKKAQVLAECSEPGASVAKVAMARRDDGLDGALRVDVPIRGRLRARLRDSIPTAGDRQPSAVASQRSNWPCRTTVWC